MVKIYKNNINSNKIKSRNKNKIPNKYHSYQSNNNNNINKRMKRIKCWMTY